MITRTEMRSHTAPRVAQHDSDPDPAEVVPFGRNGAGLFTNHPVGLFIALGLLVMGLAVMSEARWFFAGVLVLGALGGFFLWRRHR